MRKKYVYFNDNEMWLGYWEEFPDYMTQGATLKELQENLKDIYKDLKDIYKDLTSGDIPCVHHIGELEIA